MQTQTRAALTVTQCLRFLQHDAVHNGIITIIIDIFKVAYMYVFKRIKTLASLQLGQSYIICQVDMPETRE